MGNIAVSFTDEDVEELNEIVMDKDKEEALKFLKEKVLAQIMRKEKSKLDIQGKTHL